MVLPPVLGDRLKSLSDFERDLQQIFPIIRKLNEQQGMSPVGRSVLDEVDVSDVDLEECMFEVQVEIPKRPPPPAFEKQELKNEDRTEIKPSISGSTHATFTTIPKSPSITSVSSKDNINYLGNVNCDNSKVLKINPKPDEARIADDPFANVNPLDGVDPSKLPQKPKNKLNKVKTIPEKSKLVKIWENEQFRLKGQINGDDMTIKVQNLTEKMLCKGENRGVR